jgi:single-strand DNA-binding protein
MNSLNSIILEGNLTQDAVCRETSKGTALCNLSVAVNRWYKAMNDEVQKEVSFFDVQAWGKLAQTCEQLGHKGRGVRVVGRIKQDRWIDTNGKNVSKVIIVAEHIEFKPEAKQDTEVENETPALPEESAEEEPLAVNW